MEQGSCWKSMLYSNTRDAPCLELGQGGAGGKGLEKLQGFKTSLRNLGFLSS